MLFVWRANKKVKPKVVVHSCCCLHRAFAIAASFAQIVTGGPTAYNEAALYLVYIVDCHEVWCYIRLLHCGVLLRFIFVLKRVTQLDRGCNNSINIKVRGTITSSSSSLMLVERSWNVFVIDNTADASQIPHACQK